jgi:ParB/RepB/Spo0J family partition protein
MMLPSNIFVCESTGKQVKLSDDNSEAVRCGTKRVFSSLDVAEEHQKIEKLRGVYLVHREAIYANPHRNVRRFSTHAAHFLNLIESVREKGILQPLLVHRSSDYPPKLYELRAGFRRWEASSRVGVKHVPITILDACLSPTVAGLLENIKENMKPLEMAAAIRGIMEEGVVNKDGVREKLSFSRVAGILGMARSRVSGLVGLLDGLHPRVAESLSSGEMPVSKALIIAQLPKVDQVQNFRQSLDMDVITLRRHVQLERTRLGLPEPKNKAKVHINEFKANGKTVRVRSVNAILDICASLEVEYFGVGVRRRITQRAHLQAVQWCLGLIEAIDSDPSNPEDYGRVTQPSAAAVSASKGRVVKRVVKPKLPKVT